MQKCLTCKGKFKYKQVMKSVLFGYRPIECSKCNQRYKLTLSSRLSIALPIVIFPLLSAFDVFAETGYKFLFYYVAIITAIILIAPFLVRYKLENEAETYATGQN